MIELKLAKQLGEFRFVADVALPSDGVLSLFGRSGAGKTTLVSMLAGLIRPDTGLIRVAGRTLFDSAAGVNLPPEQRRIGYVFQEGRLFPHLDVRGNLLYGQRRTPAAERRVTLTEIVELLGIGHLLGRRPANLSGGEKQRVAIGRALLSSPRLLLLDEPLAALDAERKAEVLPFLERLRDERIQSIVYVSHAPDEVLRLADRVLLLEDGQVIAAGPVDQVFGRPELQRLVGGADAGAVLTARVELHDPEFKLSQLAFGTGGRLIVPQVAAAPHAEVRLRVRARDISLARTRPAGTSILNCLPARIVTIHPAEGPYRDVALDSAGAALWARVTARSVHDLGLGVGDSIYALVKAVSIDRENLGSRPTPAGRAPDGAQKSI